MEIEAKEDKKCIKFEKKKGKGKETNCEDKNLAVCQCSNATSEYHQCDSSGKPLPTFCTICLFGLIVIDAHFLKQLTNLIQ